jgi:DNA-binding response OmpR family regulator
MRLLVAEDDAALRDVLTRGLRDHGYVVDAVANGEEAIRYQRVNEYALAVVDWRMPVMSGLELVGELRRRGSKLPVLMLTARDTPADRVAGLDGGADDYLVKPFDFEELVARLRALLRRAPDLSPPTLVVGDLTLDPATREVTVAGRHPSVTPIELSILELLLRRSPGVVGRRAIALHVWDDEADALGSNTIDVHMARLRAKLAGSQVRLQTVRGVGYRLTPQ